MVAISHTYSLSALAPCPPSRVNERVGSIMGDFTREANTAGESTLGNLVADGIFWTARRTPGADPDFAVTPVLGWTDEGNLEGDLRSTAGPGRPGVVTLGNAWGAGGFGVTLAVDVLAGAAVKEMFEGMWRHGRPGPGVGAGPGSGHEWFRPLSVSYNVRVAWRRAAQIGRRITAIEIDGRPLQDDREYRVAGNALLLAGAQGYRGPVRTRDEVRMASMHEAFITFLRENPGLSPAPRVRLIAE